MLASLCRMCYLGDLKSIIIFVSEPMPVTQLSPSVTGQHITLSWKPNVNSTQDSYYIWYRPLLNVFPSQWKQVFTTHLQTSLKDMFAGERYELIVFAVSSLEMSIPKSAYAEVCKY